MRTSPVFLKKIIKCIHLILAIKNVNDPPALGACVCNTTNFNYYHVVTLIETFSYYNSTSLHTYLYTITYYTMICTITQIDFKRQNNCTR